MRSTDFIDQSNKKALEKRRVCKNHLFSYWGPDYNQCVQGYKSGQECEELKEEEKIVSER